MTFQLDEQDVADFRMAARFQARYERRLRAHPSCADPDHPGCSRCDDDIRWCDDDNEINED